MSVPTRLFALALALGLVACGGDDAPAVADSTTVVVPAPSDDVDALAAELDAVEDELDALDAQELDLEDASIADPAPNAPLSEVAAGASEADARRGLLGEALAGGWRLVQGPGETIFFETDGSFQLYIGDRLVEGGEWTAEEGILYFYGDNAYVIEARRASGMTFEGPDGPLVLERID